MVAYHHPYHPMPRAMNPNYHLRLLFPAGFRMAIP